MSSDTLPEWAVELAHDAAIPADEFAWRPVSKAVGNIRNNGESLIKEIQSPVV